MHMAIKAVGLLVAGAILGSLYSQRYAAEQPVETEEAQRRTSPPASLSTAVEREDSMDSISADPSSGSPAPVPSETNEDAIVVADGRISVAVHEASWAEVLSTITRKAPVAITMDPAIEDRKVSVSFRELPLSEGLKRLLEGQDAFIYFPADRAGAAVWVYPPDKGRRIQPIPPEQWASTQELESSRSDPDPKVRARAVQALVERGGEGAGAREHLLAALRDSDDQVRAAALEGAVSAHFDLPADVLADLAAKDPNDVVRFLALEGLAGDPKLKEVAKVALDDASPHIRSHARSILGIREQRARPVPQNLKQAPTGAHEVP